MKKFLYSFALSLALCGGGGEVLAQPVKYAQAAMPFLQITVGGRPAAMASTQMAVIGDASAMFSNPAGLARVTGFEATANQTTWLAETDINHYGAGAAVSLGKFGVFGVNVISMDYGTFVGTIPTPVSSTNPEDQDRGYIGTGNFSVQEYAAGISYARQISDRFLVGANFRYAVQNLPDLEIVDPFRAGETQTTENQISNFVADFGTVYYPGFKDFRFGMSVRNFSNQSDYFDQRLELPLTFDIGVAMNLFELMPNAAGGNSSLMMAVDWLHPRDYEERLHVGLEYGFMNMLFLRGGYKFNYDSESLTAGVGADVGLSKLGLRADYSYGAGDLLGDIHRISLGFKFQ